MSYSGVRKLQQRSGGVPEAFQRRGGGGDVEGNGRGAGEQVRVRDREVE